MKHNIFRRPLSLVLTLLVTLGMTSTVFAFEKTSGDVTVEMDKSKFYVGSEISGWVHNGDYDDVACSVTSSDPSIAKVTYNEGASFIIKGLKPGTVTLTFNYKYKNVPGSMTASLTVMEVPKVFKSLKVNGKKVNLTKHNAGVFKKAKKATKVKIKATPASGWKVKSVSAYAFKSMKSVKGYKVKVTKTQIKKGKRIKFEKKYKFMIVNVKMVNKKTGQKYEYMVQFYRNKPAVS